MFLSLISLLLASPAAPDPTPPAPDRSALDRIATWVRATDRQRISVWTDHDESPYRRGDQARVYFHAETDGYVTVLRVDTDGRIRVLFPREPWEDNFARGGRTFEVLDRNDKAFPVDDYPGVGYVFAVSSPDPFQFDEFIRGDHWDYRLIAEGRVRGDPYVALTEFASQIAGPGEYDYDIVPYYVEEHYDYPRFLCYDCHSYVSYSYWNPYHYTCNRFRIVIYDDYYYYPYRYYRGRNVVFVRPYRPGPRYVFKDADSRRDYVTRERQRPANDGRRVTERDRTSADVGGRGSIPAPTDPRRRVVDTRSGTTVQPPPGADTPRRRTEDPEVRTDRPDSREQPESRRRPNVDSQGRPTVMPRNENPPERRTPTREVEPPRSEPPRSEPRRQEPTRHEPARPETRAEPRRPEPTRAEPRRAEPRPQSAPSRPRPTGEPELRRRKPN